MPQFSDVSDVQLQLRRLQIEHELELKKLELEWESQREQRQHELKKLELETCRASDPSAHSTDPPSSRPRPIRVEAAVKLVLKFSENYVETFLISLRR